MGIILTALGYYKTNENNPQREITPFDVKLLMLSIISRLTLYKNKTSYSIKEKVINIVLDLKQSNFDIASAKMETLLFEEDLIDVCTLLITFSSILLEHYKVIASSSECPKHLEKHMQNLIYASQHLTMEDADNFRELMTYKYGESFVKDALENKNFCIDYRIVNAFKRNKKNELVIVLRLKQLARQYEIKCEFPVDVIGVPMGDYIEVDNANPYSMKNSRLFEEFEKDKLKKDDFIVDKVKDAENGFVVVESEFDMEKLSNYCNTNEVKVKVDMGKRGVQINQGMGRDMCINGSNCNQILMGNYFNYNTNSNNVLMNFENRNIASISYTNSNKNDHNALNEIKTSERNILQKNEEIQNEQENFKEEMLRNNEQLQKEERKEKDGDKNILEEINKEHQEIINHSKAEEKGFVIVNDII